MPTTTYNADNAAFADSGRVSNSNGQYWLMRGSGSERAFVVTGTAASATFFSFDGGTGVVQVSVDGGAYVDLNLTAGDNTTVLLFSGLSDAEHLVVLRTKTVNEPYLLVVAWLSVTGSAPALRAPSTAEGYGPVSRYGDADFASGGGDRGSLYSNGSYGTPDTGSSAGHGFADGRVRRRGRCSTLKAWMYGSGAKVELQIDGVAEPLITLPADSVFGWRTLATGLDAGTDHTFTLTDCDKSAAGTYYLDALMAVGGAWASTGVSPLDGLACYGDSITAAAGVPDSSLGWVKLAADALGMTPYNRGISGSTVSGGGGTTGAVRTADVTAISPAPTQLVILYGTNDLLGFTLAQFKAAYASMLSDIRAGLPITRIRCLRPLSRLDISDATIDGYYAKIVEAVAEMGDAGVTAHDTTGWIDTATDLADDVHPDESGNVKIAARVVALLSPAAVPALPLVGSGHRMSVSRIRRPLGLRLSGRL
jgi:lysophospholipase L1-like esterase